MEDISSITALESEFREESRTRKDTDKKIREAIKTLERELRDEAVSRKTAERKIVQLYDTIEALCARMTYLERKVEDLENCDDPLNCKHHRKPPSDQADREGSKVSPPPTPSSIIISHHHHSGNLTPINPPSPLITSSPRVNPFAAAAAANARQRFSAGLEPLNTSSTLSPLSSLSPPSTPPTIINSSPSTGTPTTPTFESLNSPKSFSSSNSFSPPNAATMRAKSVSNLTSFLSDKSEMNGKSYKQNGKDKNKDKDDKDKDKDNEKDKDEEEENTKEQAKRRIFSRKAIVSMLSPPTSPSDTSPKGSRKSSPNRKESSGDETGEAKIEKSRSFQLVRSSSLLRIRDKAKSFPLKNSLKLESSTPSAVFSNMGVADETCVKVIKEITSFLKNYVHMAPSDLFQEKTWSEQAIFLKEAIQSGSIPDFSFKYQHDPYSVAQFLHEILGSSEKGILAKIGQGLVDSVEIDLEDYPGLKHYKLSLLHSLVFLLDEDPHFALFYTLDLLRAFVKIRRDSYLFFGTKFGPVCLKDYPEKAPNAFSTLLINFSAILEVKEDINFVVKEGRQTVHAASLERLFEKLLDPYYRDSLFVDTFFLTFDYFISAEDMLNKFTFYYWLAATGFPQNWKTQLSIRVLVVIKMWIMTHENNFLKDSTFISLLRNFVDSVTSPYQSELSFFRYFSSLAYRGTTEEEDADNDSPILINNDSVPLSESVDLSTDSGDCISKSGSFNDLINLSPDDRSNSALNMYDGEDDGTLLSESPQDPNPIPRSASDLTAAAANAAAVAALIAPHLSPAKGGGTLSRSSSTNNIYLTKDGKLATVSMAKTSHKSLKNTSANNIFIRSTSPTPGEPDSETPGGPKGGSPTITVNPPSPPQNGTVNEKNKSLLLVNVNRRSRGRGNSDDATLLKLMAQSGDLRPIPYSPVCTIEPLVVATYMAVIDQSYLRKIPYTEWLHKSFVSQELSPNFHAMVAKFNEWGRWVCTEILTREKLADRVNVVTYFVEIIKHSVAINNFNAAAALIGGLSHSSVSRLRPTWDKVPAKVTQDLAKMTTLFEMSRNYKNYREAVKACKPPVIPYLALIPKDLIAIEEGNATILENGLINFHKLRLLAKLVKYVSQIQQPLYLQPSPSDDSLGDYLRHRLGGKEGLLADREMMTKSLLIQPSATPSKNV